MLCLYFILNEKDISLTMYTHLQLYLIILHHCFVSLLFHLRYTVATLDRLND